MPASAARWDIVTLGEAMVEFNQTGGPGSRHYLQGFGGDTSNLAIAAARQGARVAVAGALGQDPYAAWLRSLWDSEGIDHQAVLEDASAFTAIYFVSHSAQGHQFHFFRKGSAASGLDVERLPLELMLQARVLHLSGISLAISAVAREAGLAAMAAARSAGRLVSFDTNLRLRLWPLEEAREVMDKALRHCDIALPSQDELSMLTGLDDADALVDHCLARGARWVALKMSGAGALVASAQERHRVAPHRCQPVDATGAGDTFGGAFVARLLAGDGLVQAGRYAAAAAALSTEGYGAVEPIPTAQRVRAALAAEGTAPG